MGAGVWVRVRGRGGDGGEVKEQVVMGAGGRLGDGAGGWLEGQTLRW